MFMYTDEELRAAVTEKLDHPARPVAKNVPCHLRTVGMIALMMRKFEKAVSDNYKKGLQYDFDKTDAVTRLKVEARDGKLPSDSELKNTVYFIRKFDINWQEMIDINNNFLTQAVDALSSNEENDNNIKQSYLYSLALKYLCRNTTTGVLLLKILHPSKVLSLLSVTSNHDFKTELVWTLCYILRSIVSVPSSFDAQLLDNKIYQDIETIIMSDNDVSEESKAFLLNQISPIKGSRSVGQSKNNNGSTAAVHRRYNSQNRKPLVVSRTVQMVKSSGKNQTGDDVQLKVLSLATALRNRSRKIVASVVRKHFETVNDTLGSDQSMWNSTWAKCLNIYQLSGSGSRTLKKDDKDDYLPNKLFGFYFFYQKYSASGVFYKLAIHRMIASTFERISYKQQLNNASIYALMKGITTVEKLSQIGPCIDEGLLGRSLAMLLPGDVTFDKYSENLIDAIWIAHSEFDSLEAPDFLIVFYKEIKSEVMKSAVTSGWFGTNYTELVPMKSFDKTKVNGMIKKEVEKLRRDIAQALYNSACRNGKIMTEGRLKIIQSYLQSNEVEANDVDEENFQTLLLDIIDVVTLSGAGSHSTTLLNTYLEILLSNSTRSNGYSAANSIVRETKNPAVCERFMTDNILDKLMDLLQQSQTLDEIRICIVEIINNYLEQPFCKDGLSHEHLDAVVSNILMRTSSKKEVIDNILISILITAEKHQSLPCSVIGSLIKLLDKSYGDFVVLILNSIMNKTNFSNIQEWEILSISEKLCNDCVVAEPENRMVKIEQRNDSNSSSTSITLLAAQLLLKTIESSTVRANENVLRNLVSAAEMSEDKQARIVSIKCIYLLSTKPGHGCHFTLEILNRLESLVSSDIYLIGTYARAAYARRLLILASRHSEPLKSNFVYSLSSLFLVKGSLKIGEKDFVPEINGSVLNILACEARKGQKFEDENLFSILEQILYENKNNTYSLKVLEILEIYTSHGKSCNLTIPQSTVLALEYAHNLIDLTNQALWCLQNVICNGQVVSPRTLLVFVDNLQMSENSRRRLRAFKVLDRARINQDISDEVLLKLELVRAAYGLSCKFSLKDHKQKMLHYVEERCVKVGTQIPVDTLLTLQSCMYMDKEATLKVLYSASKQRQVINYNTLNKLVEKFNPLGTDNYSNLLIGIFETVARNNQTLSKKLLEKLNLTLAGSDEMRKLTVLSIFVKQVQKGEQLSSGMITKILETTASSKTNVMTKKELLGCIGSIVLYSSDEELIIYRGTLQQILSDGMMSDNINIQKLSVSGWAALMSRTQVDTKHLTDLVEICTDMQLLEKCDQHVLDNLLALLRRNMYSQHGFTENLRLKLRLTDLEKCDDDVGYLNQLRILHFVKCRIRKEIFRCWLRTTRS